MKASSLLVRAEHPMNWTVIGSNLYLSWIATIFSVGISMPSAKHIYIYYNFCFTIFNLQQVFFPLGRGECQCVSRLDYTPCIENKLFQEFIDQLSSKIKLFKEYSNQWDLPFRYAIKKKIIVKNPMNDVIYPSVPDEQQYSRTCKNINVFQNTKTGYLPMIEIACKYWVIHISKSNVLRSIQMNSKYT